MTLTAAQFKDDLSPVDLSMLRREVWHQTLRDREVWNLQFGVEVEPLRRGETLWLDSKELRGRFLVIALEPSGTEVTYVLARAGGTRRRPHDRTVESIP